jgi:pyroglutamyl-peptidase
MKTILITGFGPFPGVAQNPTAALARNLHGKKLGDVRFVGVVLPVSYRRAPQQTLAVAAAYKVDAILGMGVATSRSDAMVEARGRWIPESHVDVEGQTLTLLDGPAEVASSWDPTRLGKALGVPVSQDAGTYVCNGWLYQVAAKSQVPTGFLHVPLAGFDEERLAQAVVAAL